MAISAILYKPVSDPFLLHDDTATLIWKHVVN
jgi:hypothetical protein